MSGVPAEAVDAPSSDVRGALRTLGRVGEAASSEKGGTACIPGFASGVFHADLGVVPALLEAPSRSDEKVGDQVVALAEEGDAAV